MEAPAELPSLMHLQSREARRAALEGLAPGILASLDAAAGDPERLREVGEEWLEVALSCLDAEQAAAAAALDGRTAVGRALTHVHGVGSLAHHGGLDGRAPGELGAPELRHWVEEGLVDVAEADRYARRCDDGRMRVAVIGGVLTRHAEVGVTDEDLDVARRLFCDQFWGRLAAAGEVPDLSWGNLSMVLPAAWWRSGGPLNAYATALVWDGPLGPRSVAELLDTVPLARDGAELVLHMVGPGRTGPYLFADQVVLLDRALRQVGGAMPSFSMRSDEALDAVPLLGPGQLHDTVVNGVLEGRYGPLHDPKRLDALESLDPSPHQLACVLGEWLLAEWALGHTTEEWRPVLAECTPEAVDTAVSSGAWVDAGTGRLAEFTRVAAEVTPGLLALLGSWGEGDLVAAVMSRLEAGIGADALAWQALWRLAPRWPGTVDAAVGCVTACQK